MHSGPLQAPESRSNSDSPLPPLSPEQKRRDLLIALAIFVGAILYLWPLRNFVNFNADEGIILSDADRILRGQVPYRDFFSLYTPGSYFLLALVFKVFGQSILVARTVLLFYCGMFSSFTYLLARRIGSRTASLFATAILTLGCLPPRFFVLHNWDSTFFAVLALYCAVRFLETASRFCTTALGMTVSMTCLTEQARGAGLLIGVVIAAFVMLPRRTVRPIRFSHGLSAAAGFLLPFATTFSYFASKHALAIMLNSWLWPLRGYSSDNHVAYGFVTSDASLSFFRDANGRIQPFVVLFGAPMFLFSALAVIVVISSAAWLLRFYRQRSSICDLRVLGGCIFFGVWFATLATSRADFNHMLYIAPLFAYLLPSLLDDRRLQGLYAARPLIAALLLLSFAGFGFSAVLKAMGPSTRLQTRRGVVRAAYDDQVIPYVQARVASGADLFVYPYQPLYSYLTATHPFSRVDGVLSPTPESSRLLIAEISTNNTAAVLLERTFPEKAAIIWPSVPLKALAADPVQTYVLQHYHSCKVLNLNPPQTWIFDFMVRKDLPCPAKGI